MHVTPEHLEALNARLAGRSPLEILREVNEVFGDRAALLSSMQVGGSVLAHLADAAGLAFDVVFVDTGVLHQETLGTRDELARTHRRLNLVTLTPERTFAEQTRDEGLLYLSKEGQERCCDLRKSAPLRAVKGRYHAFVSALRRSEGGRRGRLQVVSLDPEMDALRIHPLAFAPDDFVERYAAEHGAVVVNPLHSMGFPSIGCFPCTTPVLPDEDARAGRWRHLQGVAYCGINPTDVGRVGAIELDERYRSFLGPTP